MEKLIMDLITFIIGNADKIGAAAGMIIVILILRSLVNDIGKRQEEQSKRDDGVQIKLLDLYTQITNSINRQVAISESHESAAKERSGAQEARDKERIDISRHQTEALTKITDYLNIVGETKNTVDTIQTIAVRTQGSVADLGTDITELVNRRAAENLEGIRNAVEASFQLVEAALRKMQPRLDGIAEIQDSHVEAQGQRHTDLINEIRTVASALTTLSAVMDSTYQLLQKPQQLTVDDTITPLPQAVEPPQAANDDNEDTLKSA